jgi:hypothetical protein
MHLSIVSRSFVALFNKKNLLFNFTSLVVALLNYTMQHNFVIYANFKFIHCVINIHRYWWMKFSFTLIAHISRAQPWGDTHKKIDEWIHSSGFVNEINSAIVFFLHFQLHEFSENKNHTFFISEQWQFEFFLLNFLFAPAACFRE